MDARMIRSGKRFIMEHKCRGCVRKCISYPVGMICCSTNCLRITGHCARQGNKAQAERVLRDLQALAVRQYVPASAFAVVYAALGDRTRALDLLERAYTEHDFSMAQIGVAPWFRGLRSDPRFQQLLVRLGLPH